MDGQDCHMHIVSLVSNHAFGYKIRTKDGGKPVDPFPLGRALREAVHQATRFLFRKANLRNFQDFLTTVQKWGYAGRKVSMPSSVRVSGEFKRNEDMIVSR